MGAQGEDKRCTRGSARGVGDIGGRALSGSRVEIEAEGELHPPLANHEVKAEPEDALALVACREDFCLSTGSARVEGGGRACRSRGIKAPEAKDELTPAAAEEAFDPARQRTGSIPGWSTRACSRCGGENEFASDAAEDAIALEAEDTLDPASRRTCYLQQRRTRSASEADDTLAPAVEEELAVLLR